MKKKNKFRPNERRKLRSCNNNIYPLCIVDVCCLGMLDRILIFVFQHANPYLNLVYFTFTLERVAAPLYPFLLCGVCRVTLSSVVSPWLLILTLVHCYFIGTTFLFLAGWIIWSLCHDGCTVYVYWIFFVSIPFVVVLTLYIRIVSAAIGWCLRYHF